MCINPLGSLISYFYWEKNRVVQFAIFPTSVRLELEDKEFFVRYVMRGWIDHNLTTAAKSAAIVKYVHLRKDCFPVFSRLIGPVGFDVNAGILKRKIEMSSTENIRKMGRETGQLSGDVSLEKFRDGFKSIRNGSPMQYRNELNHEAAEYVRNVLNQSNPRIPV